MGSTEAEAISRAFDGFQRGWEAEFGDGIPLPTFSSATTRHFRVTSRAIRVDDAAITDLSGESVIRTEGPLGGPEDVVRLYVVRRGAWVLGSPDDPGEQTVPAGGFLLKYVGQPSHFETMPETTARVLVLPAAMLKPLLGGRIITGPADSAELRLLMAHANMIYATMPDLGPAGVQAAHSTLIELAKAVARRCFDDMEPLLAPALTQAAKDLADSRLTDPDLRHRRLEEARLALTAPSGRLSISDLAAHWQFADSSHFIRTFKKRYGRTPTDYACSTPSAGN